MTKLKLVSSFISTIIVSSIYLVTTKFLDTIMNPKISNIIGLILDFTLDYIIQSKIFLDEVNFNKKQVSKVVIGKFISGIIATMTFNIYYDTLQPKIKSNSYIRILSIITSIVINLLLRKYWIYTK